ncbi:MAG: Z1 domain-containing protein [Gemmatimonadota bacterium]|nr:Z1 domain-containing protein [Gemmatimonadota bacterium]
MTNELTRLRGLVWHDLVDRPGILSQEAIRESITTLRPAFPGVTDDQAEALAHEIERKRGVLLLPARILALPFTPWLGSRTGQIDWHYWGRYRRLLLHQKRFGPHVVAEIDKDTNRIVGHLEDPRKPGRWDRRGMVMGHVQSGKTGNYIGVATKAADAGYRVVIIMAGVHNKLRDQTQQRVDEGFVGYDTGAGIGPSGRIPVGVGKDDSSRQPTTFTNTISDFKKSVAEQVGVPIKNLREPVVLVIKKNAHTLRNLIEWLKTHNAHHLHASTIEEPMLLIDDEADNASINIRHHVEEVSTINGLIRELLTLFDRSAYVGYTATPFANIFIDPSSADAMVEDDLFPRDFIVSLNAASNYFGAATVFGTNGVDVVREVDDHRDNLPMSHKQDHRVTVLPPSLYDAVRTFLLVRAIRMALGQVGVHNSMLVNVSRFVAVQRQVRNAIHAFLASVQAAVRVHGALTDEEGVQDPQLTALRRIFSEQFSGRCGLEWEDVRSRLVDAVEAVEVVEINGQSPDSLRYVDYTESGWTVIAVGGFSLSRGLTLEGLSVSYVLRRSMMYDTLFQMGRWFGYRDGYRDLCRVWMPEEARGWYEHISESIEELREELVRMESVGATPQDFGLKVRSHPDALVVTARNKMGSGRKQRVKISLANSFIETTVLYRDAESSRVNLGAVARLAEWCHHYGGGVREVDGSAGGGLVSSAPVELVDEFLLAFKNHPGSLRSQTEPVRRYIRDRGRELGKWDVLFAGVGKPGAGSLIWQLPGHSVVCQRRSSVRIESQGRVVSFAAKRRVATRGIEQVGLSRSKRLGAEAAYRDRESARGRGDRETWNYPDRIYRAVRARPLLAIHLLAIGEADDDLSGETPVVAWSISFPKTDGREESVEYVVNSTWFQDHVGDDDSDDDE